MKSFDVFISHSSKDRTLADAACAVLERRGLRCWIAPRNITGGLQWMDAIVNGIDQSQLLVLIWTSESNSSQQVLREVDCALRKGLTIIPLRTEEFAASKSLEFFLSVTHWLDAMTPPLENHLQQLADQIIQTIGPQNLLGAQSGASAKQAESNALSENPNPSTSPTPTSLGPDLTVPPSPAPSESSPIPKRAKVSLNWMTAGAGIILIALCLWGGFTLIQGQPDTDDDAGEVDVVITAPPPGPEGIGNGDAPRSSPPYIQSEFSNEDAEGWSTTDGNGGSGIIGSIAVQHYRQQYWIAARGTQGRDPWYWKAPAKYQGNHADKFGRYLLFTISTPKPIVLDDRPKWPYVVVRSKDEVLFVSGRDLRSRLNPFGWSNFAVRLDDGIPWRLGASISNPRQSRTASNDDIKRVLSNVTEFLISGPYTMKNRAGTIDSIRFGEVGP